MNAYMQLAPHDKTEFYKEVERLPPQRKEIVMAKAMGLMDQGRLQATQELVQRLLRKRLGALDTATQAKLARLSLGRLEELSEALLDFTRLANLEGWLKAHARK